MIAATLLFLMAGLLVSYVTASFYLETRYPTESALMQLEITASRDSDTLIVAGQELSHVNDKLAEARAAGYSDSEIAEHLSQKNASYIAKSKSNLLTIAATIFGASLLVGLGLFFLSFESAVTDRSHSE